MNTETPADPVALRAEIEQTRSDLAETVEALAAKFDVKARMRDRASRATGAMSETRDRVRARLSLSLTRPRHLRGRRGVRQRQPLTTWGASHRRDPATEARAARIQAIVLAGAAGLGALVVALWVMRQRRW